MFVSEMERSHACFGNDHHVRSGLQQANRRLKRVQNANQYAALLHSIGSEKFIPPKRSEKRKPFFSKSNKAAYLKHGRINVNSAAKQRRVNSKKRRNSRL